MNMLAFHFPIYFSVKLLLWKWKCAMQWEIKSWFLRDWILTYVYLHYITWHLRKKTYYQISVFTTNTSSLFSHCVTLDIRKRLTREKYGLLAQARDFKRPTNGWNTSKVQNVLTKMKWAWAGHVPKSNYDRWW